MNLLMVWSEVPDGTWFIIFKNISLELYQKLVSFNGKYINADEDTEDLNDMMYDEAGKFRFEKEKHLGPIIGYSFDSIIQTGFIT